MNDIVTPQQLERRLIQLGKELDEAQKFLDESDLAFHVAKAELEILAAKKRQEIAAKFADRGIKATVQEKEDAALLAMADEYVALARAEAVAKAAKGNVARVRTHVDISRSLSASVRSNMEALV